MFTKALQKMPSFVSPSFAKLKTRPVTKFSNVSKISHKNCFKKILVAKFNKTVRKIITELRLCFEAKNIHAKMHALRPKFYQGPVKGRQFHSFVFCKTLPVIKYLNLSI